MRYCIRYLDMYDYGTSVPGPEFTCAEDALDHAKHVLDTFLRQHFTAGMAAKDLYDQFMMFGEDVVIVCMDGAPSLNFRGQEYVRQRAEELCASAKPVCPNEGADTVTSATQNIPLDCLTLPSGERLTRSQILAAQASLGPMRQ